MRGKVFGDSSISKSAGITPAYAGKSPFSSYRSLYSGDHPRVCGEKHAKILETAKTLGITPAYAGKSI